MLLLADRGLYGFDMSTRAAATGADLLWRVKSTLSARHLETLDDGSWLAQIIPTSGKNRKQRTPLTVRVIDYTLDDGRENPEHYRLLTTILDPADASAEELALADPNAGKSRTPSTNSRPTNAGHARSCGRNPHRFFFPLITTLQSSDCGIRASPNDCAASTRYADSAPTPASSNAKFSNGQPNGSATNIIHSPTQSSICTILSH